MQLDYSLMRKNKSLEDYLQEQAALRAEAQQQQQAVDIKQKMFELERDKFEAEKNNISSAPFEGTGFEQQSANFYYDKLRRAGVPHAEAIEGSIDAIRTGKTSAYFDPVTGNRVTTTGTPLFGGAKRQTVPDGTPAPAQPKPDIQEIAGIMQGIGSVDAGINVGGNTLVTPEQMQQKAQQVSGKQLDILWKGTGPTSEIQNLRNKVPYQILGYDSQTTEARNILNSLNEDMIRAVVKNPRMPVAEVNNIRTQLGITPSVWTNPAEMAQNLRDQRERILTNVLDDERMAQNPRVPANERADAITRVEFARSVLNRIESILGQNTQGNLSSSAEPQSGGKVLKWTREGGLSE